MAIYNADTTATDNTPNKSIYFCPVCGNPMRTCIQILGGATLEQLDCQNKKCSMWYNTTTAAPLLSGKFQRDWQFVPVYDPQTGERLSNE